MPAPDDDREQPAETVKRGPGRPNMGPRTHFMTKIPLPLAETMKATAEEAEISASELVRRAVALYCSPDELKKDLKKLYDEDEILEPELRKYRNEMRRRAGRKPK